MRAGAALAFTLLPAAAAAAGPLRDVIEQPPRHASGPVKFTQVSHIIYLNNCLPSGCDVSPGFDDSLTQHSSIPQQPSHLDAWAWGPESWNQLVQCVQSMYAPFQVTVTDVDPGPSVPHFEEIVAGIDTEVQIEGAGGVAPFIPCDGQLQDNVISFVFASETSDLDFLCWAAAQETSHVFGLDHEMNALDPMTYLSPPEKKQGFQNTDTPCGEYADRTCWCGNPTQNTAQYLADTFGPTTLVVPSMAIGEPADGAWVGPGFQIKASTMSQMSIVSSSLSIDGVEASRAGSGNSPLFTAPTSLTSGDHTITVAATDFIQRSFSAQVTVHAMASCAGGQDCSDGFHCLGGECLPGADTAGGLGATCAANTDCITGTCASDSTESLCSGACDPGNTCPSGFACATSTGPGDVCWPSQGSSGGCTSGRDASPLAALGVLGVLAVLVRRRRAS
ncbi:MAG TPA: MYXO-CTERM sorting domain-containing protein [Kofleriaceae bacterium]|jgi:uncharacterized protein (TIGR03382 family)